MGTSLSRPTLAYTEMGLEQTLHYSWTHHRAMLPHELDVLDEAVDRRFECIPVCPQSVAAPGEQRREEQEYAPAFHCLNFKPPPQIRPPTSWF